MKNLLLVLIAALSFMQMACNDDEKGGDERQQQNGTSRHRLPGYQSPERHRSGVAHDDAGR